MDSYRWRWLPNGEWNDMFATGGCPEISAVLQSSPTNSGAYTMNGADPDHGNWDLLHTVTAMQVDEAFVIKTDTYTFTDINSLQILKDQTLTLQHVVRINNS